MKMVLVIIRTLFYGFIPFLTTVLHINTPHGALRQVASHLSFSLNLFPIFPLWLIHFLPVSQEKPPGDALAQDMGRSYVQNPPCMIRSRTRAFLLPGTKTEI